jgi:hypothetical protein
MFKVNIKNLEKNLLWSAQFESQELAQEWLSKQIGKPNRLPERFINKLDENGSFIVDENGIAIQELLPAEFIYEIIDGSAELELQKIKSEAKQYLADTDWYVIKMMDTGIAIPQEIAIKRQEARDLI